MILEKRIDMPISMLTCTRIAKMLNKLLISQLEDAKL